VRIIRGFDGTLDENLSNDYTSQMVQRRWFASAQLHMSYVLWQVMNNITPNFEEAGESVAFNLRVGEQPIFQTGNCVTYAEERTVTNRTRSYQGLSVPVGGGIYYHVGGSQGHQERTSGLIPLDGGRILIMTKALYFGGQEKTFRIALDHILRYQPYVDGVGVCEDNKAPKVFVFDYRGMDAGWFFYNLLCALGNPQASLKPSETSQCVTNLQNAFGTFSTANDSFTDLFKTAVAGARTITTEDLDAFAEKVESFIEAARTVEKQFQFTSATAKGKYHEALQAMESSWKAFASVDDGHMNGDAYVPFLDEVAAFMKARNDHVLGA
jgi:hypothetical protein